MALTTAQSDSAPSLGVAEYLRRQEDQDVSCDPRVRWITMSTGHRPGSGGSWQESQVNLRTYGIQGYDRRYLIPFIPSLPYVHHENVVAT